MTWLKVVNELVFALSAWMFFLVQADIALVCMALSLAVDSIL